MPRKNRDSKNVPDWGNQKRKPSNVIPIRGPAADDPASTDYQTPNPHFVVPPLNPTQRLLGAILAILLFGLVIWLLFHNWMMPGPRHPGAEKQNPTLQQRVP